jgi:cytochrome c556
MRLILAATLATSLFSGMALAEEEDPFADAVEARHGLMLLLGSNLGTLGAMAKGEAAYDAAVASKAAANVAALSSVLSPDLFPAGSEYEKAADSYALPAIWANADDFIVKIAALNTAAAQLQASAGTDVEGVKAGLAAVGGACSACHKAYRQPEE